MSPREIDELVPWEIAVMLNLDEQDDGFGGVSDGTPGAQFAAVSGLGGVAVKGQT
jgi:hypothetical protein